MFNMAVVHREVKAVPFQFWNYKIKSHRVSSEVEFKTHKDNLLSMRDMEGDIVDIVNSK